MKKRIYFSYLGLLLISVFMCNSTMAQVQEDVTPVKPMGVSSKEKSSDATFIYTISGKVVHFDTKRRIPFTDITLTYRGEVIKSLSANSYGLFDIKFKTSYVYKSDDFQIRFIKSGYLERIISFPKFNIKPNEPLEMQVNMRPVRSKNVNRNNTVDLLNEIR